MRFAEADRSHTAAGRTDERNSQSLTMFTEVRERNTGKLLATVEGHTLVAADRRGFNLRNTALAGERPMSFVAQIGSIDAINGTDGPFMSGDCGLSYVFYCHGCNEAATVVQFH